VVETTLWDGERDRFYTCGIQTVVETTLWDGEWDRFYTCGIKTVVETTLWDGEWDRFYTCGIKTVVETTLWDGKWDIILHMWDKDSGREHTVGWRMTESLTMGQRMRKIKHNRMIDD
jgi:hypothetical protein